MERVATVIDFSTELADLFAVGDKVGYLPGGYGGIGEASAWGFAMRGPRLAFADATLKKHSSWPDSWLSTAAGNLEPA